MHATADTVLALHDAVLAVLRTVPNLQVFDGEPDTDTQPPVRHDPDRKAGMYACLYMGPGMPDRYVDVSLCDESGRLPVMFQVTAAGGDQNRALRAALKVRAALTDQHLMPGAGRAHEQLDPITPRKDPGPEPARWAVPLLYSIDLP